MQSVSSRARIQNKSGSVWRLAQEQKKSSVWFLRQSCWSVAKNFDWCWFREVIHRLLKLTAGQNRKYKIDEEKT